MEAIAAKPHKAIASEGQTRADRRFMTCLIRESDRFTANHTCFIDRYDRNLRQNRQKLREFPVDSRHSVRPATRAPTHNVAQQEPPRQRNWLLVRQLLLLEGPLQLVEGCNPLRDEPQAFALEGGHFFVACQQTQVGR